MKYRILHESKGRIRLHMQQARMTMEQADHLQYYLQDVKGVKKAKVNERTCDAVIWYTGRQNAVLRSVAAYDYRTTEVVLPEHTGRALQREYEGKLFNMVAGRIITKLFLPAPVAAAWTVLRAIPYIYRGIRTLAKKKIEVSVLDATAITVSLLRRDFSTAGSAIFLLGIGDLLEEWTHKRSVDDLAQRMYQHADKVWVRSGKSEVLLPVNEVTEGDVIIVRTAGVIPLDGVIVRGEPNINQSSMTGEPLPVRKSAGDQVYAGTVIEEGECEIRVTKVLGAGRFDRIVQMIEDSEKLKSETEAKAAHLADRLVPFSLGGTLLTWLLTRNVNKALAILMVDYSCALKLAMPISVLSAMRESSEHHIEVKGGKFLEAVSEAKTIVFDKTGTLTYAAPHVADVIPFGGHDSDEMLRLAACLEEHFPHSMANAVVEEARERGLNHEELHTKVQYVVAHGIASTVNRKQVRIGSYHFIFEDENCAIPAGEEEKFEALPDEYSHLYLTIGNKLAAVILIEDPIRKEAPDTVRRLHAAGFDKVVMMTGDSRRTAAAVAARVGVDEYYAEVLPEDKAAFIEAEHKQGRKVIMIGDGINDSPALSEADAGIAIAAGAAIAREVADIMISAEDLGEIITLRRISDALMHRIHRNYRMIMGFNSVLIALGVIGILQPATTSLLHNASTLLIGMQSMTDLLPAS